MDDNQNEAQSTQEAPLGFLLGIGIFLLLTFGLFVLSDGGVSSTIPTSVQFVCFVLPAMLVLPAIAAIGALWLSRHDKSKGFGIALATVIGVVMFIVMVWFYLGIADQTDKGGTETMSEVLRGLCFIIPGTLFLQYVRYRYRKIIRNSRR